jgi:hypothetical protein
MAKKFVYDRFPLATNGWGTIHPMPDKAPPVQAKEGAPTLRKLIPGVVRFINFTAPH